MSNKLYNLIMHVNPNFWSNSEGCVDFFRDRFLEYTEDDLSNTFRSLDQSAIDRLKELPTLFAVEHEEVDTRIGKITNIEIHSTILRIKYKFDEGHYPLTKGVLQKNWQKLNIDKPNYEFYRTHWAIKECDISSFYEEYLKTLTGIAHQLKDSNKKVKLIYAFNGVGKTRLSREFKELIAPKTEDEEERKTKVLYYNAFTEDLFYWDNDLESDAEPKLKIQRNSFTDWILKDEGLDQRIIGNFQSFTGVKIDPIFNIAEDSISFEIPGAFSSDFSADYISSENIKISKGEESNFIWSIFYTLLDQVISVLNVSKVKDRDTDQFNELQYVFIDDPVSSLDENHLIKLAVDIAGLIKSTKKLNFIITTHSPLFYNVLYSELSLNSGYILSKLDDGGFVLEEKKGAANRAFAYHLHIKNLIEQAIEQNNVQRYHFTLLRNLYEKTAAFFGYREWADLLNTVEKNKREYLRRIMHLSSHSKLSDEEIAELTEPEKQDMKLLLDNLTNNYGTWPEQEK